MKIGLFGGTFNPFHLGHLKALNTFASLLGNSRIIVMPTGTPPHKQYERQISDEDRLEIVKLAVSGVRNAEVSDYEISRGGKSFTSETLLWLRKTLMPEDEIYLYTGSDMFLTIDKWHEPEAVMAMAEIVCFSRTGDDADKLREQKQRLETVFHARCRIIPFSPLDISASDVRKMLSRGDPDARLYLPERVYVYIEKKGLYSREDEIKPEAPGIEDYKKLLQDRLKADRYAHSLGVMETMDKLAERYGADRQKARLAGLLHDITKNDAYEKQLELIDKYRIPVDADQRKYKKLLHAVTAPYVIKYELGINDSEILSAIRFHTTARPNMTLLEKLLYTADYIDPTRDYPDVDFYRRLAFADIDRAAFLCLAYTMQDLSGDKSFIYKDTYEAYQYYVRWYEENPDKLYDEKQLMNKQ